MGLKPECFWRVGLAGDAIVSRSPKGESWRIDIADLNAVYVETDDSGPWGADVWWVLEGAARHDRCIFPQGAAGEDAIIKRLGLLPGFQVRGMNSVANERHLCWKRETAA